MFDKLSLSLFIMFLEYCEWNCIIQMYLNLFAAFPYIGLSCQYSEGC